MSDGCSSQSGTRLACTSNAGYEVPSAECVVGVNFFVLGLNIYGLVRQTPLRYRSELSGPGARKRAEQHAEEVVRAVARSAHQHLFPAYRASETADSAASQKSSSAAR